MAAEKHSGDEAKDVQTVTVLDDPAAPSALVSSKRQSLSDVFTIVRLPHCRFRPGFGVFFAVVCREREGGKEGREGGRGQGKGDIADGVVVLRRVRVD